MAIEVKRKPNEPLNIFLRRFSERVKRSGVINQYKKGRFNVKEQSRNLKKASSLERKKHKEKMTFFKKIGKIK
ncbi:hypothetical protein IID20_05110 [Patescibacteria group bacterium]|nr:hypothetical protein [Patescibacteria group bacterium]